MKPFKSGHCRFTGLWTVPLMIFGLIAQANGEDRGPEECIAQGSSIVTIGLSNPYADPETPTRISVQDIDRADGEPEPCIGIAVGNEYQVFEWLETGKIDAAVVSPFVVEILRKRGSEALTDHFRFSTSSLLEGLSLPSYRVGLQVQRGVALQPDAASAYAKFVEELLGTVESEENSNAQIFVDSHLSAALPLLLDYTEGVVAGLTPRQNDTPRKFWNRFLETLVLCDPAECEAPKDRSTVVRLDKFQLSQALGAQTLLLNDGKALRDLLVHEDRLHGILSLSAVESAGIDWRENGSIRRWLTNKTVPVNSSLGVVFDSIYASQESGFRSHRHFSFTLDELWTLLGAKSQSTGSFALVLTGGGVKAAFQTELIDQLYSGGYLTNGQHHTGDKFESTPGTIPVNQIIGTSGGAMLGAFVAWMADETKPDLSNTLWKKNGKYIEFYNIFPRLEMPRWLTLVIAALVFSFVLFVIDEIQQVKAHFRRRKNTNPKPGHAIDPNNPPEHYSGFPPRLVWMLLLAITPFVLKIVHGPQGLEHVPATAGLAYALCMLIAVVSDNRLVFDRSFSWSRLHPRGWGFALFAVGILLIVLALVRVFPPREYDLSGYLLGIVTRDTLICCLGLLALFAAMHQGLATSEGTKKISWKPITGGLLMILLVGPLANLLVWMSNKSMFELTFEFWVWLLIWSLVVSLLFAAIAGWIANNRGPEILKSGYSFLLAPFPKSTLFLRLKRHARITFFIALGFGYWNFVMAPGLYGNETAVRLFDGLLCKYITQSNTQAENCKDWSRQPINRPPSTTFVVTATSLEKKKERYFVFDPTTWRTAEGSEDGDISSLAQRLRELEALDPRWQLATTETTWANALKVLFASGSPFPVFPATRAGLTPDDEHEWLVDGGYAHNVPVEAAHSIGAKTVLVISSSILHEHEPEARDQQAFSEDLVRSVTGNLLKNIPRLFPYLFERSQTEDTLSADQLVVATLSPIKPDDSETEDSKSRSDSTMGNCEKKWPILTDFTSDNIKCLLKVADSVQNRRIGMVENWGTPICALGRMKYHCEELSALGTIQSR